MIISRGEAVRNFLYSDTLKILTANARVTLLSVVSDARLLGPYRHGVERIIFFQQNKESKWLLYLRKIIEEAHFAWLKSAVAKNHLEILEAKAVTILKKLKLYIEKIVYRIFAHQQILEWLTRLENYLTWRARSNDYFPDLFRQLKPDIVFNCSHIHGPAAELPVKIAYRMNIPTAGFIFSWDNLTSRSRILTPYNYYFVWYENMKKQLLSIYPRIRPENVFITGTPQFDFHFQKKFQLSREELYDKAGLDPERSFILYTTGIARHFPEEYRMVEEVIRILGKIAPGRRPQLALRPYIKDTSPQMDELIRENSSDMVCVPMLWERRKFTPLYEDIFLYTGLLRHCCLGINPASTVSLELLMYGKPVINLGFDPPGISLPRYLGWIRHIRFDHYRLVAESGAVSVAYSAADLEEMIFQSLENPGRQSNIGRNFIRGMFGNTLDGNSGIRVAEQLLKLARRK